MLGKQSAPGFYLLISLLFADISNLLLYSIMYLCLLCHLYCLPDQYFKFLHSCYFSFIFPVLGMNLVHQETFTAFADISS